MTETVTGPPRRNWWRMIGRAVVFVWFFLGGIGHFVLTKMFVAVVPPYVPFPLEVVYFTGGCEIAGALALLHKPLRQLAGWCLIALAICVTPVHIEMLIHADRYQALELPVLWGRLLFQPMLIWIIWSVTNPRQAQTSLAASG